MLTTTRSRMADDVPELARLLRRNVIHQLNLDLDLLPPDLAGQVKALPQARCVLVVDYADRVESIQSFINRMEAASAEAASGLSIIRARRQPPYL